MDWSRNGNLVADEGFKVHISRLSATGLPFQRQSGSSCNRLWERLSATRLPFQQRASATKLPIGNGNLVADNGNLVADASR
jgi:hypothetical protein